MGKDRCTNMGLSGWANFVKHEGFHNTHRSTWRCLFRVPASTRVAFSCTRMSCERNDLWRIHARGPQDAVSGVHGNTSLICVRCIFTDTSDNRTCFWTLFRADFFFGLEVPDTFPHQPEVFSCMSGVLSRRLFFDMFLSTDGWGLTLCLSVFFSFFFFSASHPLRELANFIGLGGR